MVFPPGEHCKSFATESEKTHWREDGVTSFATKSFPVVICENHSFLNWEQIKTKDTV